MPIDPRTVHFSQDACDIAIAGLATDGTLLVSNAAAERFFHFDESLAEEGMEWVGKRWRTWDENFERELSPEEVPLIRAVRGEAVPDTNYGILLPDGSRRIVFMGGSPIYDTEGSLIGGTIWSKDITLQRQREQQEGDLVAAQRLTEHWRQICDLMPVLMWTANSEGNVDWWNQTWYEYTGGSGSRCFGIRLDGIRSSRRPLAPARSMVNGLQDRLRIPCRVEVEEERRRVEVGSRRWHT